MGASEQSVGRSALPYQYSSLPHRLLCFQGGLIRVSCAQTQLLGVLIGNSLVCSKRKLRSEYHFTLVWMFKAAYDWNEMGAQLLLDRAVIHTL